MGNLSNAIPCFKVSIVPSGGCFLNFVQNLQFACLESASLIGAPMVTPEAKLSQYILKGSRKTQLFQSNYPLESLGLLHFLKLSKNFNDKIGVFVMWIWKKQNPTINSDIIGYLTCIIIAFLMSTSIYRASILCQTGHFKPGLLMDSTCQSSSNGD